jgi:uncharacterized membrane protein YjjP (DUF1212 family)
MRWKEEIGGSRRGRNWMSAMGILFMVSAAIILISNFVQFYINYSAGLVGDPAQLYLDSFINGQITSEKVSIAMVAAGSFLLYWGFFRKKEDYGPPDERERRQLDR